MTVFRRLVFPESLLVDDLSGVDSPQGCVACSVGMVVLGLLLSRRGTDHRRESRPSYLPPINFSSEIKSTLTVFSCVCGADQIGCSTYSSRLQLAPCSVRSRPARQLEKRCIVRVLAFHPFRNEERSVDIILIYARIRHPHREPESPCLFAYFNRGLRHSTQYMADGFCKVGRVFLPVFTSRLIYSPPLATL